jgi:hypothetical protein
MTRKNGALAEARLDETLDDSFPASDPPSFTPVAHVGEAPRDPGDASGAQGRHTFLRAAVALGAAAMFAGGLVFLAIKGTRRRRARPMLRRALERRAAGPGAALAPVLEVASERLHDAEKFARSHARAAADRLTA